MDKLVELLNDVSGSSLKNDQMLLDLCKEIIETITDMNKIITTQQNTIRILTDTITTHNRVLRSLNAERFNDDGQDSGLN